MLTVYFGLEMAPRIDEDSGEAVCEFINKYISASPPVITDRNIHDVNLRQTLQNIFMLTTADKTILVNLDFQTSFN